MVSYHPLARFLAIRKSELSPQPAPKKINHDVVGYMLDDKDPIFGVTCRALRELSVLVV